MIEQLGALWAEYGSQINTVLLALIGLANSGFVFFLGRHKQRDEHSFRMLELNYTVAKQSIDTLRAENKECRAECAALWARIDATAKDYVSQITALRTRIDLQDNVPRGTNQP